MIEWSRCHGSYVPRPVHAESVQAARQDAAGGRYARARRHGLSRGHARNNVRDHTRSRLRRKRRAFPQGATCAGPAGTGPGGRGIGDSAGLCLRLSGVPSCPAGQSPAVDLQHPAPDLFGIHHDRRGPRRLDLRRRVALHGPPPVALRQIRLDRVQINQLKLIHRAPTAGLCPRCRVAEAAARVPPCRRRGGSLVRGQALAIRAFTAIAPFQVRHHPGEVNDLRLWAGPRSRGALRHRGARGIRHWRFRMHRLNIVGDRRARPVGLRTNRLPQWTALFRWRRAAQPAQDPKAALFNLFAPAFELVRPLPAAPVRQAHADAEGGQGQFRPECARREAQCRGRQLPKPGRGRTPTQGFA